MMPLGGPSISKYGSLVRPDAQIVALRAHCARALRLRRPQKWLPHPYYVTPAFSGVPIKGDKIESGYLPPCLLGGPPVGGSAT